MLKLKAIDLFCGAGGLSAGLLKGGFDVCLGVDNNKAALQTYRYNMKQTKLIEKDIRMVSAEEIAEIACIEKGGNFLLAGCPPCQGFSNIGKRDEFDIKNELVYDYVRIVNQLEPSFILMENVPGMAKGVGKKIFSKVVELLSLKYHIEYEILNAADYGVPQLRKRLVLHGIRKNVYEQLQMLEEVKILPKATHSKYFECGLRKWRTVGDTIMDLPSIEAGEEYKKANIYNHMARNLSELNKARLAEVSRNGGDRSSLSGKFVLQCHKKTNVSYTDTYGVMRLDSPAPTITSGCTIISKGRYGHPTQIRGLSVREAARLQSFDDDFVFVGNMGEMSLQVGNAVPPDLAKASAKQIKRYMEMYQVYLQTKYVS